MTPSRTRMMLRRWWPLFSRQIPRGPDAHGFNQTAADWGFAS
ncbi:hypothetical protein [Hymenobacter koreensis]